MKRVIVCIAVLAIASMLFLPKKAKANGCESDFIGSIGMQVFRAAPVGWMHCEGQTLQIAQNQALYSLLGNNYGGDGRTTFCLPDMRAAEVALLPTNGPASINAPANAPAVLKGKMVPPTAPRFFICVSGMYPNSD